MYFFKRSFLLAVFYATSTTAFGQFRFDLSRPNFVPLIADPKETRIAVLPNLNNDGLTLDIGATLDLARLDFTGLDSASHSALAFGVDFGTFSLLRREWNFKFPVDAADYIFGINLSYRAPLAPLFSLPTEVSARFRLSHISAHLIDGSFDLASDRWRGRRPFTFSREFISLVVALSNDYGRLYLGYELLFNTLPSNIAPQSFQSGIELYAPNVPLSGLYPFLAIDFRLSPVWRWELERSEGYGGTTSIQLGVKTGVFGARGVRVVYNYASGLSWRGMYIGERVDISSFGLFVDF